ncbi:VRR-NUC domain-containing protein [Photobacterium makurazakiensis]|uniref:VRR-NUC domain-containing protein n=1 Tax=Photobacterium makurazakiensis TaxID=2910234 RepID=UPI003D143D60
MNPPQPLRNDYYLSNVLTLIEVVTSQYSDLMSTSELTWLHTFGQLSDDAKKLYIRLLSRKGALFRFDKLAYSEIDNIELAAIELANGQFAFIFQQEKENTPTWPVNLAAVSALFTKPELLRLFDELSAWKSYKKDKLVDALCQLSPDISAFQQDIIELRQTEHLNVFLLLFFGNSHQSLTDFVLSDLGIQHYENYNIDRQYRFFNARENIEQWLALSALNELYWQAKEEKDFTAIEVMANQLPQPIEWLPLERKRQKLINHIARDLERFAKNSSTKLESARLLFSQSELPPSRERQVRILDKQHNYADAYQLACEMQLAPKSEEEADIAATLVGKLARKLSLSAPPRKKPRFTNSFLTLNNTDTSVELVVAEHYSQQGWQCYFLENTFICGLFGLTFWDIIFSDVKGAFLNPFQRSPKGMFTPEFYQQRKAALDKRLEELQSGHWQHWLDVFQEKQGITNDWVNWTLLTPNIINHAIAHFPIEALCTLFKRILFDPKSNRSGFPDLIAFNEHTFRWIEVKGPGDKLQSNQIRWLNVFEELELPAEVVYVEWSEAQ